MRARIWRLARTAASLLRPSTIVMIARGALYIATGGWLLAVRPKLNAGVVGGTVRLVLFSIRYVVFWSIVWVAIWQLAPTVLVGSRAGLQTLFQMLPATIVAVLVLVLGSVFVIAQLATTTWGTRTPVMISLDERIVETIARPLLLLVGCLLLSGQVPDSGEPAAALTAAVAVLVAATIRMLIVAAMVAPAIVQTYTAPRSFPQLVVEDLDREYEGRQLELVVFRGPMLGEMLKLTLRRGDSVATRSTLEAIADFQAVYLRFRAVDPAIRDYVIDNGSTRSGWLAEDLTLGLVAAGEEGLRLGGVAGDLNMIARVLAALADEFDAAGDADDAIECIEALTMLSTAHAQVSATATNVFSEPVGQLAWLEAEAERRDSGPVATRALTNWTLGASYARYHLGAGQHPLQPRSIRAFGLAPPWLDALALIFDSEWQREWSNMLPDDPRWLVEEIQTAARDHAKHHKIAPPDLSAYSARGRRRRAQ